MIRDVEKRLRLGDKSLPSNFGFGNFGPVVTFRENYFSVSFVEILIYFSKVVVVIGQL